MRRKVHCRSLSSIHILYNNTPTALLKPYTEPWCGLLIFQCPEVVCTMLALLHAASCNLRAQRQARGAVDTERTPQSSIHAPVGRCVAIILKISGGCPR